MELGVSRKREILDHPMLMGDPKLSDVVLREEGDPRPSTVDGRYPTI